jgi:hypothetical protein
VGDEDGIPGGGIEKLKFGWLRSVTVSSSKFGNIFGTDNNIHDFKEYSLVIILTART